MEEKETDSRVLEAQRLLKEWQNEDRERRAMLLSIAERDDEAFRNSTALYGKSALTIIGLVDAEEKNVRQYVESLKGIASDPVKHAIGYLVAMGNDDAASAIVEALGKGS